MAVCKLLQVASKSKELKHNPSCAVDPSQQGISLSSLMNNTATRFSLPDDLSLREGHTSWNDDSRCAEGGTTTRRRVHATAKDVERTMMIGTAQLRPKSPEEKADNAPSVPDPLQWTQSQQRLLESAMVRFPRGSADRWDRVAELVPGKTKVLTCSQYQCIICC